MLTQFVGIKSHHGKYLTSSSGGKIACDKNDMKDNEVFTIRQEGAYITIKTRFGKYISVTSNGGLEAEKDKIGNTEKFELELKDNNKFNLKSCFGFYVSAQKDWKIDVNKKQAAEFETFQFVVQKIESLTEFLKFN